MRRRSLALGFSFLLLASVGVGRDALSGEEPKADASKSPTFDDVRPLFQAKCVRCHGGETAKADLDLRTHGATLKGGETGPVVVPGKPEKSLLFEKVHEGMMPPGKK